MISSIFIRGGSDVADYGYPWIGQFEINHGKTINYFFMYMVDQLNILC